MLIYIIFSIILHRISFVQFGLFITTMSSFKKFKLIDTCKTSLDLSQQPTSTNWTAEPLTGYQSLAENLVKFDELGELPQTLHLDRMNEGQSIESNEAKWHKSCRLRYNNQMLQRTEKREHQSPVKDDVLHKSSRLQPSCKPGEEFCFFCDEEGGTDGLHEVSVQQSANGAVLVNFLLKSVHASRESLKMLLFVYTLSYRAIG